jgi:protein phosphatase
MTQGNFQINSASVSDRGLSNKRPQNEDSYLELRDSGLYAVADGVGGAQAGDVASQMAMEILGEAFINLQEDGDAEERMKLAIQQANGAIFQMSNDLTQLSTMATTVVALHIQGNIATIGHVGDSRLYRLDSQGNLLRETQDHSVVEEEVRAGRMTSEQAAIHPSRNVISRALGADDSVEIDMKTIMFEPNTTFLVCTDGVTRHIPDEELKTILQSDEDTFVVCQQIKTLCFERGAEDNLTAVVVRVTEEIAENFDSQNPVDLEIEEETVAIVRPPLVNSSLLATLAEKKGENLDLIEKDLSFDQTFQDVIEENGEQPVGEEIVIPLKEEKGEDSGLASTKNQDQEISESSPNTVTSNDIKSYRVDENSGNGVAGKLISAILWLVVGGLIGGALVYWYFRPGDIQSATPPPTAQTLEITAFENNRRNVDKNPQQFIARNVSPKDSVDHYLIGRAYLNQGNFESAKREFLKAKEKLSETSEINRKTLSNDIALGLAVINDLFAQEQFRKEMGLPPGKEIKIDESKTEPESEN